MTNPKERPADVGPTVRPQLPTFPISPEDPTVSVAQPISDNEIWTLCSRLVPWFLSASGTDRTPVEPYLNALVRWARDADGDISEVRVEARKSYAAAFETAERLGLKVAHQADEPAKSWPKILTGIAQKWNRGALAKQSTQAAHPEPAPTPPPDRSGSAEQQNAPSLLDTAPELFTTPDGTPWCSVLINGHRESYPLHSAEFKSLVEHQVYVRSGSLPDAKDLKSCTRRWEGEARFGGSVREVFNRVAGHDGRVYVDLCNSVGEVVEVSPSGWRVVADPPVRFRRTKGMRALPRPVAGGSLDELRPFVNVADDDSFRLLVATLTSYLLPKGPYIVLALVAEQESAKSTTARLISRLASPSLPELRQPPHSLRDLTVAAKNSWLLSFENLSELPHWLSNAFCVLSTGGGDARRRNFTDDDETLFEACRPIVLNGIESFITKSDLKSRAIVLDLPPIPDDKRRDEAEFWGAFDVARPRILGALLDVMSAALRELPTIYLASKPRMADFARWAAAVERAACWPEGSVLDAYAKNRGRLDQETIEATPFATALVRLMDQVPSHRWEGTPMELLNALQTITPTNLRGMRTTDWPDGPPRLGVMIRLLAPALRKTGLLHVQMKRADGVRKFVITASPKEPSPPSPPSSKVDAEDPGPPSGST